MNDPRFIELLNLYVDHQLTPAEAVELENELARNPARRRTYADYCRMQKACVALLETQRAQAPLPPRLARALAQAERKISLPEAARDTARRLRHWWLAAGALTTAAAALVIAPRLLVTQNNAPANAPVVVVSQEQPAARPVLVAAPQDEIIDPRTFLVASVSDELPDHYYSVLPARMATRQRASSRREAIALPTLAKDSSLQWLNEKALAPLVLEASAPLQFTPRTTLPRSSFSGQSSPYGDAQAEMTSFQFQK